MTEYQVGKASSGPTFLGKAWSRQDGPAPWPAESQKCPVLGKWKWTEGVIIKKESQRFWYSLLGV